MTKADRIKLKVQHDPLPNGFKEVRIDKAEDEKLGMVIKGGLHGHPGNPNDSSDEGVFISKIHPGGVASQRQDELIVGQRIIEVNGRTLLGVTHEEATAAMRTAGNSIHLLVCDGWNASEVVKAIQNGNNNDLQPQAEEEERPPRPNSAQEVVPMICPFYYILGM